MQKNMKRMTKVHRKQSNKLQQMLLKPTLTKASEIKHS